MSKAQGDGYRTWTDNGLNKYYDEVFYPALVKAIDEKEKTYYINGGKITCIQKNNVQYTGYKVKSIKIENKEYTLLIYSDENSLCADAVEHTNNKEEANRRFIFWKGQLKL